MNIDQLKVVAEATGLAVVMVDAAGNAHWLVSAEYIDGDKFLNLAKQPEGAYIAESMPYHHDRLSLRPLTSATVMTVSDCLEIVNHMTKERPTLLGGLVDSVVDNADRRPANRRGRDRAVVVRQCRYCRETSRLFSEIQHAPGCAYVAAVKLKGAITVTLSGAVV